MGEKKFLEKCHFLVPKIGFTQFLNDLGPFFGLKNGRKKFFEKIFLVPLVLPISEIWGIFGNF